MRRAVILPALAGLACLAGSPVVHADIDPLSGIDFVTVGAPGNRGYDAFDGTFPPGTGRTPGRGAVAYEYKIGRYEVTSGQWVEFFNAAYDRAAGDSLPHLLPPSRWGGISTTPTHTENPNARRWTTTPQSAMLPTGNISWRMAAMYCNWLCNDKRNDRGAFLNGAYDVSTFGYSGTTFTDQLTHHPGSKYYVPTWDEWLKAAHYDPNATGPQGEQGRWWVYSNRSDTRPFYGPPGVRVRPTGGLGPDPNGPLAEANGLWGALDFPGSNPFAIPLGAYPTVTSPWGLLDTAGGSSEWTEEAFLVSGIWPTDRIYEGSPRDFGTSVSDTAWSSGGDLPSLSTFELGFRIASSVPSPGFSAPAIGLLVCMGLRRRRNGGFHERSARRRVDRGALVLRERPSHPVDTAGQPG